LLKENLSIHSRVRICMKAVICAAGQGKRLKPLTKEYPKALLPLGGKTIIEHILDALSENGIREVVVVVGYKAEKVKKKIGTHYKNCRITYVYNAEFKNTNNMYSLWLARKYIKNGMIFFNADTVFHPKILRKVLASKYENCFIMSPKIEILADAMKVRTRKGRMEAIGKTITGRVHGEAFGIYKVSQNAAKAYFKTVTVLLKEKGQEEDGDRGKGGYRNGSFVIPLQRLADTIPLMTVSSGTYPWVEIDIPDDYRRAKKIIKDIADRNPAS